MRLPELDRLLQIILWISKEKLRKFPAKVVDIEDRERRRRECWLVRCRLPYFTFASNEQVGRCQLDNRDYAVV